MRITRNRGIIGCATLIMLLTASTVGGLVGLREYLLGPVGHYFDSNGVTIHYTDEGSGVPVLLVHGFANPANLQWRRLGRIDALKQQGYRVIALDNRGHGRSEKPHDPARYGREMSEDLARLLDHLNIPKAHVVGYSMGGFITLRFVCDHPDRVLSAAVCGAGWIRPSDESRKFAAALADAIEQGDPGPLPQRLGVVDRPLRFTEKMAAYASLACFNDASALAGVARSSPDLSVSEEMLQRNPVPVLTIVGEKDGFLPEARDLHAHMPHHTLIELPHKTHMDTDVASAFLRNLEDFLREHSPEAPPAA